MREFVKWSAENTLTVNQVAELAIEIARSGSAVPATAMRRADVASTGGPTSLSTLICPLVLSSAGISVPKLGVPGRPAGGVDVMAQLPSFKYELTRYEFMNALSKSGFAHFLAGGWCTPLDADLFAIRKDLNQIADPNLATASLLGKKMAVGVQEVGLDIRVAPYGNFGSKIDQARKNAEKFIRVAEALSIQATCFITDATVPYQPFVGRREALLALKHILDGHPSGALEEHYLQCIRMTEILIGAVATGPRTLKEAFEDHLSAQGSSFDEFEQVVDSRDEESSTILAAKKMGYVSWKLDCLRSVFVQEQAVAKDSARFPDPIGLEILASTGARVACGQPLARLRTQRGPDVDLQNAVLDCCDVVDVEPSGAFKWEVING